MPEVDKIKLNNNLDSEKLVAKYYQLNRLILTTLSKVGLGMADHS